MGDVMKVALLSFHNAYNFGAALQAFALQEAVKKMDVDCEYINYVNESRRQEYDMLFQIKKEIKKKNISRVIKLCCGIPFMMVRGKNFDLFYTKYLQKTKDVYSTSQEASALNDTYDKFIVGSDQVWNYENNGSDWAFLLDFVKDNVKKISYSSSFGIISLEDKHISIYKENLSTFNRLSTREIIGVEIIKQICDRDAHLVLDPVFLLEKKDWEDVANSRKRSKDKKYIFFYTNRNSQLNDFLLTGYKTEAYKYHILSSHVTPKDFVSVKKKVVFSMAPEDFILEIMNADLVVSASFHCLAMAIILHKPFVAILTGDQGKDERVTNLLKITGLEERVLTVATTQTEIDAAIDYDTVEERLNKYREISKLYLYNAIFDKEDIAYEYNYIPETRKENKDYRFCMDSRCTGCSACYSVCPCNAIEMRENEEGFLFPVVDEDLCISCGLCHNACQVFSESEQSGFEQRYYGFKNRDEIRKESSSGGFFSAIADYVLKQNGVIFAAKMDDNFTVSHVCANSQDSYRKMRQTFYVQSDLKNTFREILNFLKKGTLVLFVGTPCQVEGLKLFLRQDYNNLLTVDIICHGVPSPGVFRQFIGFLKTKGILEDFKFRDKLHGWSGYHVSAIIGGKKYINSGWLKSFNCLFSHNLINRKACSSCKFANYNRSGDISIGDFWGIENVDKSFKDNLGVSLVIVNTKKGLELFEHLEIDDFKEYSKENTTQTSLKKPSSMNLRRDDAFAIFGDKGYAALAEKYGEYNLNGFLKEMVRSLLQ